MQPTTLSKTEAIEQLYQRTKLPRELCKANVSTLDPIPAGKRYRIHRRQLERLITKLSQEPETVDITISETNWRAIGEK